MAESDVQVLSERYNRTDCAKGPIKLELEECFKQSVG